MGAKYCTTFAEAKFNLERQLVELGVRLDPGAVEVGLCEDNIGVIIYHPDGSDHWVTTGFDFAVAIDPEEFDEAYFVAQFTDQSIH